MTMNIAIDGPAGAGKSTIAKLVSKKLGFIYVDTGAMYRGIALYFLKNNIDFLVEENVINNCSNIDIELKYENKEQMIYLNGENVSKLIRTEEVGNAASKVAAIKAVREKLLSIQRNIAKENDVVMDGRDIGTNILPNADVKIYMTASVETRAKRRFDQLVRTGKETDIEQIKTDIEQRDYQDMNRAISPLKQADDAYYLDTSNMTIDEVVNSIIERVK
ncbi:MAG: (d)CMP kinase [Lachnospiraceae bacterium]|nr:(d)CMP kinase [Lachnospiraceae bacterium]